MLLVIGTGAGAVAGAAWVRDTIRTQDQERAAAQAHTVYPDPVACEPADLAAEVSGPESVNVGNGATFVLTVTNTGDLSCLLDAGGSSLGVLVTSGAEQVWASTACPVDAPERPLLLGAGDVTEVTVSWNGYVATSDCAVSQAPAAGASAEPGASSTTSPGADEAADSPTPSAPQEGSTEEPGADPAGGGVPTAGAEASGSQLAGEVAAAGVYRFRVVLGDQDLSEDTVFVIVQ